MHCRRWSFAGGGDIERRDRGISATLCSTPGPMANAVARHVSLNRDAVGTMYGQHVFGLKPKGQY